MKLLHSVGLPPELTVGRLRRGLRRRRFDRAMRRVAVPSSPDVRHLGSEYGGWMVPEGALDASCVCYSVGAGHDVSFDLELIRRFGCTVRSFDPSEDFGRQALAQAAGDHRFSFDAVAVSAQDGPLDMYPAREPGSGSLSAADLYGTGTAIRVSARSLPALMAERGDDRIDLLKLDVEGLEYELLPTLDLPALGVRLLLVELHHNRSIAEAHALLELLRADGFDLRCRKDPSSFTLLRG